MTLRLLEKAKRSSQIQCNVCSDCSYRFSSAIAKHWDELIPSFPPLTLITSPQAGNLFHFTLSSFLNHSITSSFSNHVNLLLFPFHIALMTFASPSFDGNLLNRQFWISAKGGRAGLLMAPHLCLPPFYQRMCRLEGGWKIPEL